MSTLKIPIRLKVLATILVFLMLVVGVITAAMAELFHEDKTAYVRDLAANTTTNVTSEIDAQMAGYVGASHMIVKVLFAAGIDAQSKQMVIEPLFENYPGFIAIATSNAANEPVSIYNVATIPTAGASTTELLELAVLADDHGGQGAQVHGVELITGDPAIIMTFDYPLVGSDDRTVVVMLAPDVFSQSLNRPGPFEAALVDAHGKPLSAAGNATWAANALNTFESLDVGASSVESLGVDGVDYFVGAAQTHVGGLSVVTRVSVSAAYLTARQLLNNLILFGMGIVLIAAIGGVFVSRRFTRPLERLSSAVRKVAKGNFDVNVNVGSSDEIGQLGHSFNDMADELHERERSLKSAELALVQSEKMAAVGTLSAGLAHEVKNPLSAVLGYAQMSQRKLDNPDAVRKNLETIESETRRCNEIISNLMQFSRQESGEFADVDVNSVVEKAIGIVDHQLGLNNVTIETELTDFLPPILGNANQLQQVLMNLAINAEQAMQPEGGVVKISTYANPRSVFIAVEDTGPGVPADVAEKIFQPFFTTKAAGDGTGLGLSVSYGIVGDHMGDISVESGESGGARFVVRLPSQVRRELASNDDDTMEVAS